MRLIDADALANRMQFLIRTHHRDAFDALNEIDNAPTIDPESLAQHLRDMGYKVEKCLK